jgi:hypothetical protein
MSYDKFAMIRKIKLELSGIKPNTFEPLEKGPDDPCYEDYVQVGTKMVDGKSVPNCVPLDAQKVKEGFPIPSPSGDEDEQTYVSRCMKEIGGEYEQEQALAICYNKYREK